MADRTDQTTGGAPRDRTRTRRARVAARARRLRARLRATDVTREFPLPTSGAGRCSNSAGA